MAIDAPSYVRNTKIHNVMKHHMILYKHYTLQIHVAIQHLYLTQPRLTQANSWKAIQIDFAQLTDNIQDDSPTIVVLCNRSEGVGKGLKRSSDPKVPVQSSPQHP